MKPPNSYKEVQKLTGCLTALNRFISKSGEMNLPFFKNLRGMSKEKFSWDEECSEAFEELKIYLGSPQLLSRPEPGERLQLYIAISDVAEVEGIFRVTSNTSGNRLAFKAGVIQSRLDRAVNHVGNRVKRWRIV
ncbi:hypothetical protein LIER_00344 [Lithospermum erythrorhizon]|uniref:Uncharacterized protein n=1 Tax=Lithospermum erythrorhizon TaxID=34254 RepID=A0AAV3NI60_LITER